MGPLKLSAQTAVQQLLDVRIEAAIAIGHVDAHKWQQDARLGLHEATTPTAGVSYVIAHHLRRSTAAGLGGQV